MTRALGSCLSACLLATAAIGCSADDDKAPRASLGEGNFALSTTLFSPESETSLVSLVVDPKEQKLLDTARSLEVPGTAALFGQSGRRLFSVGSSDAPVLTRYAIAANGELREEGERVSFGSAGIASGFKRPELVPFISEKKAYWLDDGTMQVVVWNPDEMAIEGTFSLARDSREGWLVEFGEAVMRDGFVFLSASYYSEADGATAGREALVYVIDSARDELVDVLHDERCGYVQDAMLDDDGTIYLATSPTGANDYLAQQAAGVPEPCVLRIAPGARSIDPDFYVKTSSLADGKTAGGLVRGLNGRAYVLAFHEELLDEPLDPLNQFAAYESKAWRWWHFDVSDMDAGKVTDAEPLSAAARVLRSDDGDFIANADYEAGRTTLLIPQEDGNLHTGLEMMGYPFGFLRLE